MKHTRLLTLILAILALASCQGGGQTTLNGYGVDTTGDHDYYPDIPLQRTGQLIDSLQIGFATDSYYLGDSEVAYVTAPRGTYARSAPNAEAPALKTYFHGEQVMYQKGPEGWAKVLEYYAGESGDDPAIAYYAYLPLEDISQNPEDVKLTQADVNQVLFASIPGKEIIPLQPYGRSVYLDTLLHIELIDKATYDKASEQRVEQFVIDTTSYRSVDSILRIPLEGGGEALFTNPNSEEEDTEDHYYIGRISKDGAHLVYGLYFESVGYTLVDPKKGRIDDLESWISNYPYLSPDGRHIISVGPTMESYGNLILLRLEGGSYREVINATYQRWLGFASLAHAGYPEDASLVAYGLPQKDQFWSRDGHFYLATRTIIGGDISQSYYLRCRLLEKK